LTDDEAWAFITDAHTGILTTLRRDGMPVAMPLWFAAVEQTVYAHTRGKKIVRVRHDPRASFLVETGERWRDLQAVHLTGVVEVVELDGERLERVEAEVRRKYDPFRIDPAELPAKVAATYGTNMSWIRFTPDDRILSWNNSALLDDGP
jgi:nitroimidazol reductase NimA-like FMN-containing flavoprotein (pyridoxamine 5'-phosphate oxidase superfamily)